MPSSPFLEFCKSNNVAATWQIILDIGANSYFQAHRRTIGRNNRSRFIKTCH